MRTLLRLHILISLTYIPSCLNMDGPIPDKRDSATTVSNKSANGEENESCGEFFFAIPQFDIPQYEPKGIKMIMAVTNPTIFNITIMVTYFGLAQPLESVTVAEIAPRDTFLRDLPEELNLRGAIKHRKSVHLIASGPVFLQVSTEFNFNHKKSAGGFTVLPKYSLTKDYIVATHCASYNCTILVTSVEDNNEAERVEVHLRISEHGSAIYKGQYYQDGDTIEELNLDKGDSMQVLCGGCDMTGTHIKASRPVAVFAGGEFTNILEGNRQDMVIEQMMPMELIGKEYVLGSRFNSFTRDLIKVVVLNANESFFYQNQVFTSTKDREVFYFSKNSDMLVKISSNCQVLVAQFTSNIELKGDPDATMNLPVPVSQWSTSYWTYILPIINFTNPVCSVLLCVLSSGGADYLQVSGNEAVRHSVSKVSSYELLTMQFNSSGIVRITCSHSDCKPFSAVILYNGENRAWSYVLSSTVNLPRAVIKNQIAACTAMTTFEPMTVTTQNATETTNSTDTPSAISTMFANITDTATFPKSAEVISITTTSEPTLAQNYSDTAQRAFVTNTTRREMSSPEYTDKIAAPSTSVTTTTGREMSSPEYTDNTAAPSTSVTTTTGIEMSSPEYTDKIAAPSTSVTTTTGREMSSPEYTDSTAAPSTSVNTTTRREMSPGYTDNIAAPSTSVTTTTGIEMSSPEYTDSTAAPSTSGNTTTRREISSPGYTDNTVVDSIKPNATNIFTQTEASASSSSKDPLPTTAEEKFTITSTGIFETVCNTTNIRTESTEQSHGENDCQYCCSCVLKQYVTGKSASAEEKRKREAEIRATVQKDLLMDRKKLSSYIRTKISVDDKRRSSQLIGIVLGVAILTAILTVIIGVDVANVIASYKGSAKKNSRQRNE